MQRPRPAKITLAPFCGCHDECSPDARQWILYSKPPHFQILLKAPLKMGPRRLPAQRRARRPGSLRYNCVLCSIRRLHCHPDSSGVPAGRATARGAAIGAPTGRHPSCHHRRSAGFGEVRSGRLLPQSPRPSPDARPPSIPKWASPDCDWFDGWPDVAAFRQAFRVCL